MPATGCAVVSSLAAGLVPALGASDTAAAVQASTSRSTGSRDRQRWRTALLMAPQAFRTTLMLGLAGVGLLLGALGIAGVTARTIAERMPEFGVRLALGCEGVDLWRCVVFDQLRIVLAGATLGLGLAGVAGRLLATMLPEAAGFDLAVTAGAIAVLAT